MLQQVIEQASAIAAAAAVAAVQEAAEAAASAVVDGEVTHEEEHVPAPTITAPETSRERIFVEHKETGTVYTAEKVGYANGQSVYVSSDTGDQMHDWDPESSACDWKLIDEKTYLTKLATQAGDQEVVMPNREARREAAKRSNNGRRRR